MLEFCCLNSLGNVHYAKRNIIKYSLLKTYEIKNMTVYGNSSWLSYRMCYPALLMGTVRIVLVLMTVGSTDDE